MSKNTLNILVVSASSLSLARKIRDEYPGKTVIYCREADNDIEPVTSFKELTGNLFDKSETIVFIGAMGICVRSIAPYIKSKYTDPAVICLDSTGKYVVSVLSGHIGGANELTHELARILDAEAVVTTQSDNQGLWALDTFAKQYGWEQDVYNPQEGIISFFQTDFEKIDEETFNASREKAMNECVARFVNCRPTALLLDIRTKETDYMKETCPPHVDVFYKYKDIDLEKYELLITVSPTYYHKSPIPCLSFFPKVLHLGIGCKKGIDRHEVRPHGPVYLLHFLQVQPEEHSQRLLHRPKERRTDIKGTGRHLPAQPVQDLSGRGTGQSPRTPSFFHSKESHRVGKRRGGSGHPECGRRPIIGGKTKGADERLHLCDSHQQIGNTGRRR